MYEISYVKVRMYLKWVAINKHIDNAVANETEKFGYRIETEIE